MKDGSKLKLKNYEFKNNEYDAVVFNKKKEYDNASLFINELNNNVQFNYLIGFNNNMIKGENVLTNKIDNKIINKMFY